MSIRSRSSHGFLALKISASERTQPFVGSHEPGQFGKGPISHKWSLAWASSMEGTPMVVRHILLGVEVMTRTVSSFGMSRFNTTSAWGSKWVFRLTKLNRS
ncbi:hypothetical protein GDO81_022221 [Engystomops pustulosus]|uniref:Uncharacterized protein n=1 Tax=Engystomops pustulosus TaxID=76066 RepID=A0AAV6YY33_ENGPU|nr:hypothetical protein GDO81_022221 [Engystomops pustulosus]